MGNGKPLKDFEKGMEIMFQYSINVTKGAVGDKLKRHQFRMFHISLKLGLEL